MGIIDFENVSTFNDPLIKDITIVIMYQCRDKKTSYQTNLRKAKVFLDTYSSFRKLSSDEISLIPDIITAGAIEDFNFAYWMLFNDPERAKLYRLEQYARSAIWHNEEKQKIIEYLLYT